MDLRLYDYNNNNHDNIPFSYICEFTGMLYGSIDHHIHIVNDIETGLAWCAAQYELNKVQIQMQRDSKTSDGT